MGFGPLGPRPIPLPCPHCKAALNKALSWFQQTDPACPNCGKTIDSSEIARALSEVDKAMTKLNQTLERFGRES